MDLYKSISQRKACRKFDMQPFDQDLLNKIESKIKELKPLYTDSNIKYHFSDKVKGLYHVDAPHYLIISGQATTTEQEEVGFMFQQLVLWFDAMNIGSVWLGESKDVKPDKNKKHIVTIAFGHSIENIHRSIEEFRRKPIETITNIPEDICMQAVHLAPSGMNTQPWFFEKQNEKILVYKKKLKPPLSLIYKLSNIDMGIALCHYYLACTKSGKEFKFIKNSDLPKKSGYLPFGLIL